MTRTRRWICMLVLAIINLITINQVSAKSYTATDTIMSQQYHELFNNYFDKYTPYQYFTYACTNDNDRTCYYGIDSKGNYLNIIYNYNGSYNGTYDFDTGIDENFSVTGVTYKGGNDVGQTILFAICFVFVTEFMIQIFSHLLPRRRY